MFKIGDKVEVLDEGLAMLRKVCPDMGPNHHGIVLEAKGDLIFVEFPIDGKYGGHPQVAHYPVDMVRIRE